MCLLIGPCRYNWGAESPNPGLMAKFVDGIAGIALTDCVARTWSRLRAVGWLHTLASLVTSGVSRDWADRGGIDITDRPHAGLGFRQRSRHGPCSIARDMGYRAAARRIGSMECVGCGSVAVSERSERTAQGYRRFRCRACGTQFNQRSAVALVHFQTEGEIAPTPSCYASTGWRRTESGRPAANIRFSTATPMVPSVCWAAKPRTRSRGPISIL
jgi:transposase-like protein